MKDIVKGLIVNDLTEVESNLSMNDFDFLFETKLIGFVYDSRRYLNIDPELLSLLNYQNIINSIRNINLLHYTIYIDYILAKNSIERCWLKGVRDIYVSPSLLKIRRMTDIDLIVKDTEKTRSILLNEGLDYGGYDFSGNWFTMSKEEREMYEKDHYELFPLSKELPVYNIPEMDSYYLNKGKIYLNESGFFTDVIYDVHRELTFDLQPEWIFKKQQFLPVMEEIDDLWYMINKCYYEIIQGDSINFQSLLLTISKLKKTHYKKNEIREMLVKTGFYNEDALGIMYELSNADFNNSTLNDILEHIINKAEKIITATPTI